MKQHLFIYRHFQSCRCAPIYFYCLKKSIASWRFCRVPPHGGGGGRRVITGGCRGHDPPPARLPLRQRDPGLSRIMVLGWQWLPRLLPPLYHLTPPPLPLPPPCHRPLPPIKKKDHFNSEHSKSAQSKKKVVANVRDLMEDAAGVSLLEYAAAFDSYSDERDAGMIAASVSDTYLHRNAAHQWFLSQANHLLHKGINYQQLT